MFVPEALFIAARSGLHCTLAAALEAFSDAVLQCGCAFTLHPQLQTPNPKPYTVNP